MIFASLISAALLSTTGSFDHEHGAFTKVLSTHVRDGQVSYRALVRDRAQLDGYVAALARAPVDTFTDDQALAFWINAYNAFTLRLIIDQRPKQSIRDIEGAWDAFKFTVAGRSLSLNQIEHDIIRKRFNEPLIHVVLVCAAKSCPVLESRAFTAKDLQARLHAAATRFARDSSKNSYDSTTKELAVSQIFSWYGDDFVPRYAAKSKTKDAAIRAYFTTFSSTPIPPDASIRYVDYDWRLNGTW